MAVGLKTLLEAAQYIEEQEQQQKSPLSGNHHHHFNNNHHNHHFNSSNLINESNNNNNNNNGNSSCFIAHYSLAVSAPKTPTTIGGGGAPTKIEDHTISLSPIDGSYHPTTNGNLGHFNRHKQPHGGATDIDAHAKKALFATSMTCQPIMQQQQQHIINKKPASLANASTIVTPLLTSATTTAAAAAAASSTTTIVNNNGFSLTAKTKNPTEFLLMSKQQDHHNNILELNNNQLTNNNNNNNKSQLLSGTLIQQHINPTNNQQLLHLPTSVNAVNVATTNVANFINNNHNSNNSNSSSSSNNNNNKLTNIKNDDFDTSNILLSPIGGARATATVSGRVRSASTSSNHNNKNVFVLGIVDPGKTTNNSPSNLTNLLQTNVHNGISDNNNSKGLQMMIVNSEATTGTTNNLTPCNWMLNSESPQRANNVNLLNCIDSSSSTQQHPVDLLAGSKSYTSSSSLSSMGNNVRRRTISSTSNGAGTREVHNKLEKNRRAHLKECYERLKNQLNLKDEDRKKTSNLAVLGEALNQVMALQKQDQELEAKIEQLAKDKINSQKRIVSLKRELGPRYEQIFSGIFPDNEITMTSIPHEKDNFNNTSSLGSGRGSTLYSSSNSLSSSGGSTCSNLTTLSSAIGTTHLHTNPSTTIIPVITKSNTAVKLMTTTTAAAATTTTTAAISQPSTSLNSGNNFLGGIATSLLSFNNTTLSSSSSSVAAAAGTSAASPFNKNNDIFLQNINKQQSLKEPQITIQQQQHCPASPGTAVVGVNNLIISTTAGLTLTAKNISETSLTRGSPTPSTPSPSPSSSSGVSSSSSFISSSPPMTNCGGNNNNNSVTSRQICINMPNGMKFQQVANGNDTNYQGKIANGETAVVASSTITAANIIRNNNKNANHA